MISSGIPDYFNEYIKDSTIHKLHIIVTIRFPMSLKIIYFLRWPFPSAKKKKSCQVINVLLHPSSRKTYLKCNSRVWTNKVVPLCWRTQITWQQRKSAADLSKTSDKLRGIFEPFINWAQQCSTTSLGHK